MSRDYGRIYTTFWTHAKVKALGRDGRELAAYLLTCEHSNAIGCYPLAPAYIADDLSIPAGDGVDADIWTLERVSNAFEKVEASGWAYRFSTGRHIVVTEFIDPWNKPENPNVVKRMIGLFDLLPRDPLRVYPLSGILTSTIGRGKSGEDWLSPKERRRLETLYQTLSQSLPKGFRKPNLTEPNPPDPHPPLPNQKDLDLKTDGAASTASSFLENDAVAHSASKKSSPARESDLRGLPLEDRVAAYNRNRPKETE